MQEYLSELISLVVLGGLAVILASPFILLAYVVGKAHEGDKWLAEHGMKGYEHWKNFDTKK